MQKKVLLISVIIASILLASCGSAKESSRDYYAEAPAAAVNGAYAADYGFAEETYAEAESVDSTGTTRQSETFDDSARKLIKTYNLTIETEEFDGLMESIEKQVTNMSGYIQNMDTSNGSLYISTSYRSKKSSTLTIRIPKANLEAFVDFVGSSANVTYKTLSVEDVTLSYVDIESRKASYEIEQERLLSLLERADNMQDIISIEERLSEVRYLLESMESQLRTYDNLVDYATVHLTVNEVEVYTAPEPVSYGERIVRSFTDSVRDVWEGLKNFVVGFVGAIPVLFI